jgi:flagellar protein FliO/FliZ
MSGPALIAGEPKMDLWDSMIRMVSALAVVLTLMFILVALARRIGAGRMFNTSGGQLVQVLGSSYIGPRKTVTLVSVAGELLVVGTTATDVVPLGRLPRRAHPNNQCASAEPPGSAEAQVAPDPLSPPFGGRSHSDRERSERGAA